MAYPTIQQIAQFILSKAPMSNFKINQLCYYADSWNFVANGNHFAKSDFQVWINGAIDPKIHEQYADYLNYQYDNNEKQYLIPQQIKNIPKLDPSFIQICNQVYTDYGHYTDMELESLIHQSDPWKNARKGLKPLDRCDNNFNDQDLLDWFAIEE